MNTRSFSVGGVRFLAASPDGALPGFLSYLDSTIVLDGQPADGGTQSEIRLHVQRSGSAPPPGERKELLHRSISLSIWALTSGYELVAGETRVIVHEDRDQAELFLHDSLWKLPLPDQRELLVLSFLMLLRRRQRFGLHANAVASNQRCLLIAGPSGSGKTSLSLCFIQQGWRFTSDDASLLRPVDGNVEVQAFRRGFSCPTTTLRHMRALHPESGKALPGDKRLVDLAEVMPEQFMPCCRPEVLLFPEIVSAERSTVTKRSPSGALTGLMAQSPGIMTDVASATRQSAVLADLVRQTSSYRIRLGRDVFENPEDLASLVESLEA